MNISREDKIIKIVEKIEKSELSPTKYIQRFNVPFSIAQFYRYRAKFFQKGKEDLKDKRKVRSSEINI